VSADHYAGAARGWAEGAAIVYWPIARELVAMSPHALAGRVVLDQGAGTGVASMVLTELGARPLALDLSFDMLAWDAGVRPPAAIADVARLPLHNDSVDDTVSAFVLNHLTEPEASLREVTRVTRAGGVLLASVYANASQSDVRDAIDEGARAEGWHAPDWYVRLKTTAVPRLGTADAMASTARSAGLVDVLVDERAVDVGVTEPEQLVDYRLGQAPYAAWLAEVGSDKATEIRNQLVESIRPKMRPFLPIVVFLSALVR